ncbi:P3N-PIPO polyprotein, partial [Bienertia sinuspersici]
MSKEFFKMWKKGRDDECGENKSLLALWIKSHTGKDKSFLSGIVTDDLWYDDVNAEVELLRLKYPTKSQLELENEAFMENYEGYGKIQRNIIMVVLKKKWLLYTKKNDKLEKEKEKLKDKVVIALRKRKSSLKLLNCTQELLGMTHQQ